MQILLSIRQSKQQNCVALKKFLFLSTVDVSTDFFVQPNYACLLTIGL